MDRREIADLTARLYIMRTGVPYGVAMMLSPQSRDLYLDILGKLNGDIAVDADQELIDSLEADHGPPSLTLIDLEAERAKPR